MFVTSDDYLKAIRAYVSIAKNGKLSRFLQLTTTVSLRNYCLFLVDQGLSTSDEFTFRYFFQLKKEEDLKNGILKWDVDRFRPIKKFLDGKTETPNPDNLEFIAVLINFKPRPYSEFQKKNGISDALENDIVPSNQVTISSDGPIVKKGSNPEVMNSEEENKNGVKQKIFIGTLSVLSVLGIQQTFFKKKECMKWVEDHYELVDCIIEKQGAVSYEIITPYDGREFERRELTVCDTTVFFVNGNRDKPKIWYDKEKDGIHYFNMDGKNPETGDYLNPITDYMIEKYVKPCE